MSLTFKQIQDELIPRRFPDTTEMRTSVRAWINEEGSAIWYSQPWTFRAATSLLSVTSNDAAVTGVPADLATVLGIWNSNGDRLQYVRPQTYYDNFYGDASTNIPAAYTIVNGAISVGPTSSETKSDYKLLYQKGWTQLVADADIPGFPGDFHYLLVHAGGTAGRNLLSDFTYQFHSEKRDELVQRMRAEFLSDIDDGVRQFGGDPLGYWT